MLMGRAEPKPDSLTSIMTVVPTFEVMPTFIMTCLRTTDDISVICNSVVPL